MPASPPPPGPLRAWLRAHPGLVAVNLACALAGPFVGLRFLSEIDGLRAAAAGLLGGAGVGFLVTCTRLLGDPDRS